MKSTFFCLVAIFGFVSAQTDGNTIHVQQHPQRLHPQQQQQQQQQRFQPDGFDGGWQMNSGNQRVIFTDNNFNDDDYNSVLSDADVFKRAVNRLFTLVVTQLFDGIGVAVQRAKRDASTSPRERDYLDFLATCMGAVMDRQRCRQRVTCQTGKFLQKMPGSPMLMTLADATIVPDDVYRSDWYKILKDAVNDLDKNYCVIKYVCELSSNHL